MADHVTNRMLRDKACTRPAKDLILVQPQALVAARLAAEAIRRVDGDAVAVHDHRALGHRRVIRKDDHGILFGGVQLNDRGAAEKLSAGLVLAQVCLCSCRGGDTQRQRTNRQQHDAAT
jgi:hypothetical protein